MTAKLIGHTAGPWREIGGGRVRPVTLEIRHLDTDSYSRSVDRAAMRAAGQLAGSLQYDGGRGTWAYVSADYSAGEIPDDGRGNGRPYCTTLARFEIRERVTTS